MVLTNGRPAIGGRHSATPTPDRTPTAARPAITQDARSPMPRMFLTTTDGSGREFPMGEKPITIGRSPENVLSVNDTLLSRFHCVVEPAPSRPKGDTFSVDETGTTEAATWHLRDLGSRNGTRLNGVRVTDSILRPGDVIKIGTHSFIVQAEESLAERQSAARDAAATAASGGAQARVPDPVWVIDVTEMINMLPPRNSGADDRLELIDGRGRSSGALASDSEGSRAVRLLLLAASKARATDIHLEPRGDCMQARMRVDGQMLSVVQIPNGVGDLVYGLIKTACQMRPTGREAVLDGHFSAKFPADATGSARRVDYRVSFTPSVHGQKLVIRVLDMRDSPRSLTELGLAPYMYDRVRKVCEQEAGMLLVCGPTGSGKTTTLYNALRVIDREARNVITIEDPVEYHLEGVTQIPIDDNKGNTFGSLLRSVLRQDPDVILLGEIRDEETARTAMQAAVTGHLVFSTVHAKDTMSSVFRLIDLKVEPYLVANSLELVLAQRLVRVLCDNCKRPIRVTPGQATRMGRFLEGQTELYTATGCAQCLRTGFRGRRAIYELLDFTDELRDVIIKDPTIAAMKRVIEQGLFTTLVQSGWVLAARGITTLDEVDRVATSR
ncbi:MAG: Flp pilus assembly complex ATPase component TadA [Phycisphaeraceae bacterium]|nr:Flp pilus assembly complex ATPase component TadA [Phycisphaeraceae bacterium]